MLLNIRVDGDIVIIGNFGRLMNDPRYIDASRDTVELLDQGSRSSFWIWVESDESGSSFLRLLRHDDASNQTTRMTEAVIAHAGTRCGKVLNRMAGLAYEISSDIVQRASGSRVLRARSRLRATATCASQVRRARG